MLPRLSGQYRQTGSGHTGWLNEGRPDELAVTPNVSSYHCAGHHLQSCAIESRIQRHRVGVDDADFWRFSTDCKSHWAGCRGVCVRPAEGNLDTTFGPNTTEGVRPLFKSDLV